MTIGMFFGNTRQSGVWLALSNQWRMLWRNHDCLYIAAGRARLRIMKPAAPAHDGKEGVK